MISMQTQVRYMKFWLRIKIYQRLLSYEKIHSPEAREAIHEEAYNMCLVADRRGMRIGRILYDCWLVDKDQEGL